MTQRPTAESSGVSRRTFLGASATVGSLVYLAMFGAPSEPATAAASVSPSTGTPPERPHRTLLGLL